MDQLKKQVVNLSVELDDKEKIQHALEKRIQKERADIETAEVRIPEEHEHIIRTETEEQSYRLNKLVDQLKKLTLEKERMREACASLKDQVLEAEDGIRRLKVKSSESIAMAIESQSKQFRAGYESRLQKQLAKKANEVKELTAQDMKPILRKLELDYEHEKGLLEIALQREEQSMRSELQSKLQDAVDTEEKRVKENVLRLNRLKNEQLQRHLEDLNGEFRVKKDRYVEEMEDKIAAETKELQRKVDNTNKKNAESISLLQKETQKRLVELRASHQAHMESMRRSHLEATKVLEERFQQRKATHESSPPMTTALAEDNGLGPVDRISSADDIPDAELREYYLQLLAERDALIKQEIRNAHTNTVRLEREWKRQWEQQKQQLTSQWEAEERMYRARIKDANQSITESIVEQEDLRSHIKQVRLTLPELSAQSSDARAECQELEHRIAELSNALRERRAMTQYKLSSEESQLHKRIKELRLRYEQLTGFQSLKQKQFDLETKSMQEKHDEALEAMEKEIKATVAMKDREIAHLHEEIATATDKVESLQTMLRRYSGKPAGSNAAEQSTAAKTSKRETRPWISSAAKPIGRNTAATVSSGGGSTARSKTTTTTVHRARSVPAEEEERAVADAVSVNSTRTDGTTITGDRHSFRSPNSLRYSSEIDNDDLYSFD